MRIKKNVIVIFIVLIVNAFYCQNDSVFVNVDSKPDLSYRSSVSIAENFLTSDTIKNDTTLSKKIDNLEAKLDKLIKVIKEDKDTTLKLGVLSLKDNQYLKYRVREVTNSKVSRKDCREKRDNSNPSTTCIMKLRKKNRFLYKYTTDKSLIEKVRLTISNGVINDITVYTENEFVFSNNSSPIDIDRVNLGKDLLTYNDALNYSVLLNSFLIYEKLEKGFPNDVSFELNDTVSKAIYQSTGINSLINVRLYSDVLGLIGEESNGLAQTEVDFSIPVHRKNIRNRYKYYFSDFNIQAQLSRLDEKYQATNIDATDSSFSRINYNQRKWFNIEAGLTAYSRNLTKKSMNKFNLNLIAGLNVSKFGGLNDTANYAFPYLGLNPELILKSSKNMGIKASAKVYFEYFTEKQHESYGDNQWYFAPQLELFYNPLGKPGSKIFSRINYVTLTKSSGAYWNFQFGYNISISELINDKVDK